MTKRQYEEHKVRGHVKYHPGCRHCVRSRALADKHYNFQPLAEDKDDPAEGTGKATKEKSDGKKKKKGKKAKAASTPMEEDD